ncbi:hypothetical protein GCM10018773_35860 [Streptomyces candidus]|nr:hypothetical protein GCM10018773_35860 [Streptomyces candidus]
MRRMVTTHEEQWSTSTSVVFEDTAPADEIAGLRSENLRLRRALRGRAVTERAQGMVMALMPCSRDRAQDLLSDMAGRCGLKVREVALALVSTSEGRPLSLRMQGELARAVQRQSQEDIA